MLTVPPGVRSKPGYFFLHRGERAVFFRRIADEDQNLRIQVLTPDL